MSEPKREIVQIATSVEITYATPEGRAAAILHARKAMRMMNWYNTGHGGMGARLAPPKGER